MEEIKFSGIGLNGIELRDANALFKEYLKQYSFTQLSDVQLLNELVYREILQDRFKKKIEKFEKKHKDKEGAISTIPPSMLESIDDNFDKILKIKESLGLLKDKSNEDSFTYIQKLKEKFKIWKDNNQASRTITCPECSKLIMLRIRTDIWEAQKHAFFKDKILYNEHLINLYKQGKITSEDVGKVLGTTPEYTDWLIKKFNLKPIDE